MAGGQRFWFWGQVRSELDSISPHDLSKFCSYFLPRQHQSMVKFTRLWRKTIVQHGQNTVYSIKESFFVEFWSPRHVSLYPLSSVISPSNPMMKCSLWYPWNTKKEEKFLGTWTNWTLHHLIHIWTFTFIFQYFNWQPIPWYGPNKYQMLNCHWYTKAT